MNVISYSQHKFISKVIVQTDRQTDKHTYLIDCPHGHKVVRILMYFPIRLPCFLVSVMLVILVFFLVVFCFCIFGRLACIQYDT